MAKLTVPELKALAKRHKLSGRGHRLRTKAELIAGLLAQTPPLPDNQAEAARLHQEVLTWQAFTENPSLRATAKATGLTVHRVREIIYGDPARLDQWRAALESRGRTVWLARHEQAHAGIELAIDIYMRVLESIAEAVEAGSLVTGIAGRNGLPMTVIEAQQFVVSCRAMDQLTNLARLSAERGDGYANGKIPDAAKRDVGVATLSLPELALRAKRGGFRLTASLEAAARIAEDQEAAALTNEKTPPG